VLAPLVATVAPTLLRLRGVGTDTAAALLIAAGDNPDRLRSEAAFAHLCGVAPIPALSGKTTRHRLHRGGNRDANRALWIITMSRLRWDPRTQAYMERRIAEGKTKLEVVRCLKRFIAREVYRTLTTTVPATRSTG
jgi:transposase